jgi:hypothetical protein
VISEAFDDDSIGFDDVERAYVRRHFVPDFEWVDFDRPSPRNILSVSLNEARVGLVSTAGAHLTEDRPIGAGGGVRMIPLDTQRIRLTHGGDDTERAMVDPEVVYPVRRVLERIAPAAVERLSSEEVDLALLVPA